MSDSLKIVVISPHPDDESLGAGGFILKHKKSGDGVYWINMTDVEKNQGWDDAFVERRERQIKEICEFYDFDGFYNLGFRPGKLEVIDKGEIIERLGELIKKIEPDWVVLPNPTDAHGDHQVTYDAGMSCTKIFRYTSIRKIMTMEIISETDFSKNGEAFSPNYYVDISNELEDKVNALRIYDTEFKDIPFPRNYEAVKALALLRGGAAGCKYAEAFRIIKEIDKLRNN